MPQERAYFGTDGIRGKVGEPPITPDFVMRLGFAAGRVLSGKGSGKVLIGKDTRISGYMFESALEAGLISAGIDIRLLGPMPTPAIAYLTQTLHADAGIVISASHNPYEDNGIKFFSGDGAKLPDAVELEIERALALPMQTVPSAALGKAERVQDAAGRYIEFCKSTIPYGMDLRGLKIVVDCAHGATYHIAPAVLDELGADVVAIGCQPDGLNINDGCGATAPELLRERVAAENADLGIALDGDGDRLILVDAEGEILDGDEVLFIIAESRCEQRTMQGGVVGTVMTNLGLEEVLRERGIALKRAKVGDRYVLEAMTGAGWTLGGETSGHIICLDRMSTGDGIVAALEVLAAMRRTGKALGALKGGMSKYPQLLRNVRMPRRMDPTVIPAVAAAVRAAEAELGTMGRVLLRPSGTEPVVRVMVEGQDQAQVETLVDHLAASVADAMEAVEHQGHRRPGD
ncbi:MAG: phosphoglucosamine mutase [Gammaproteobacteria bacterium]|nr:phosphoglucosamine mutase [Gammaproteobacteria bacterium]